MKHIAGGLIGSTGTIRSSYQRLSNPVNTGQLYSASSQALNRPVKPVGDPGLHPGIRIKRSVVWVN